MQVGNIDLERISQIAFLRLTDEEKQRIEKSIISELDGLKKVGDLSEIAPTTKITKNICYRKDEVVTPSKRDDLLSNATGNSNGAFTVPKIVE